MRSLLTVFVVGCLGVLLVSCAPKPMTTEVEFNRNTGEFTYVNERDCDILLELAPNEETKGSSLDLKALRKIETKCGQNKGFQALQQRYFELQDARLRELQGRLEQALGVGKKVAPVPIR